MSLTNLFLSLKGGPKSGNFGHSGRPGKRGGSTSEIKYGVYPKPPPKGLYEAIPIPPIDNLSYNFKREGLALEAKRAISELSRYSQLEGKIKSVELVGSYLSKKEAPKDLDMMIEFSDTKTMMHFLKDVQPNIKFTYGPIEFMGWSKDHKVSHEVYSEYIKMTQDRYETNPIDVSSWINS